MWEIIVERNNLQKWTGKDQVKNWKDCHKSKYHQHADQSTSTGTACRTSSQSAHSCVSSLSGGETCTATGKHCNADNSQNHKSNRNPGQNNTSLNQAFTQIFFNTALGLTKRKLSLLRWQAQSPKIDPNVVRPPAPEEPLNVDYTLQ